MGKTNGINQIPKFRNKPEEDWFFSLLDNWTTSIEPMLPSEWAEANRYLPASVTSQPGYFSFEVTPYMKEILDCLGETSPIREVYIMKGVQLAYTTAIIENLIGYVMAHVKTAPAMLVTADSELATLRMNANITPMIQASNLQNLIVSDDLISTRKTGKTDARISWVGGGSLVPIGAQNPSKLRSASVKYLLMDEADAWPPRVGKDGDPIALTRDRTAAFEISRKIVGGSTPTIKGISAIENLYEQGDKRHYFVPCLKCGEMQTLKWHRTNKETGEITGILWDQDDDGRLIKGTARYVCRYCSHPHYNDDKTRMLAANSGAEWRPTAIPRSPDVRSYKIPALYSPAGMQSFDECVAKWMLAWDTKNNRVRDVEKLQVFYNNVLAETFELKGEKLTFEHVSPHRRHSYLRGQINNTWAEEATGSRILFLVCTVDVQESWLAVGIFGFCVGGRCILIDYIGLEGDCTDPNNEDTWGELAKIKYEKTYTDEFGRVYRPFLTVVDSGFLSDNVYTFAAKDPGTTIAIKGVSGSKNNTHQRHFAQMINGPAAATAVTVTVDAYKERIQAALRTNWSGQGAQPERHFNAPLNITDKELKELTVEVKREKINTKTKAREGWYWHRPNGTRNELWDLLVYAYFAYDYLAFTICPPDEKKDIFSVDWNTFYKVCESEVFSTSPPITG